MFTQYTKTFLSISSPLCLAMSAAARQDLAQRALQNNAGGIAGADVCAITEDQKYYSQPDAFNNNFGQAIAMSNDVAIVGAPGSNQSGVSAGAAHVFNFNGSEWALVQTLLAPDPMGSDMFGASVDVHNDIAIVGAPGDDHPGPISNAGSAYIFRHNGTQWMLEAKLIASDAQNFDDFGTAVAVDGNRVLVGAPDDDDMASNAGAVYAFAYNGTNWIQTQKLYFSAPGQGMLFGYSLAIDGNSAVAGMLAASSLTGFAQTLTHNGSSWALQSTIAASDGQANDRFGAAVAISGDRLVVGAPQHAALGSLAGAAYAYFFNGTTWVDEQKLVGPDTTGGDRFGSSAAIDGQTVVVGAPFNTVYWYQGAQGAAGAGSGYVFTLLGFSWQFQARLNPHWIDSLDGPNGFVGDLLGTGAAFDSGRILLGAPSDDLQNQHGSMYAFTADQPDCDNNGVPDNCDPDCNSNLLNDTCEIAKGSSGDCDVNQTPDECDNSFDYYLDSGFGNAVWGLQNGGDFIWLNQFTVELGHEHITHIAAPWTSYTPEGTPGLFLLYDDPNNDGDPSDAVLLATAPMTGHNVFGLSSLVRFTIEPIERTFVGYPGESFFIGAYMTHEPGEYVAASDNQSNLGRSWRAYDAAGKGNINDLPANATFGMAPANYMLRGLALDCNGNGVWDQCDIDSGTSVDANNNGIPDECEFTCEGDILADGNVNVDDLLMVINSWGPCTPTCVADIAPPGKPDGVVNVDDLLLVVNNWGPCE